MPTNISTHSRQIHEASFRNTFVDELPGEVAQNTRSRSVPGCCYSRIEPTPVSEPRLLAWSEEFATYLNLSRPDERGPATDVLAGNLVMPGMKPYAARYGGHQFGNWAGQLGDGRAISLGEVEAADHSFWEIQLKGAGPTPYSRRADGRAVLRSSLREFLCSEAMHYLGVPTTRALSLIGTGDTVIRDMFYSGDPQPEQGAIVARVAPTFVRFGNFEIMAAIGEIDNLRSLAEYVLRHHYPEFGEPSAAAYLQWFEEICRRTAVVVAHWMSVGFVHGVMNTDNMSILGLTIDYGPYGWLEPYEPDWTPNTTDFGGRRYAFGQQPRVALWNLMMLGQALAPLVPDIEALNLGLDCYRSTFAQTQQEMMRRKLGFTALESEDPTAFEDVTALIEALPPALESSAMDMTIFFRELSHAAAELVTDSGNDHGVFQNLIEVASYADASGANHQNLLQWLGQYAQQLRKKSVAAEAIREGMLRTNPKYVLRNYLAQQAIEAADGGDLSVLQTLMKVLKKPYDEHSEHDELAARRPAWASNKPGCATLSCSS